MKKKSLFALFSSLAISGLLLVGSANAMTYTVKTTEANKTTKIAIPNDSDYNGITIDWGDGGNPIDFAIDGEICKEADISGKSYIQCEKTYDNADVYEVKINSDTSYTFGDLYLSDAHVKSITDFDGFEHIGILHLDFNSKIELTDSSFTELPNNVRIYLTHNQLENYNTSITNIKVLDLRNNRLRTIPDIIRNNREGNYIELSNNIHFGDFDTADKRILLDNNQIKFVRLTEDPTENYYNGYSDNHFKRIGYDHDHPSNPTFRYKIKDESGSVITGGTTESYEINNIDTPLKPGNYTFEVCIDGDDVCDYNNANTYDFSINYNSEEITFDTPTGNNPSFISLDGIGQIIRRRRGIYPSDLVGGYSYKIEKDGNLLVYENLENLIEENITTEDGYNAKLDDIKNIIEAALGNNDPSGRYKLTVYLVDKNNQHTNRNGSNSTEIYAEKSFTIDTNNEIHIEKPGTGATITAEGIDEINVPIEWRTDSPYFESFKYVIANGTDNDCAGEMQDVDTANLNTENGKVTYSENKYLETGEYTLCVKMYDNNGTPIGSASRNFSVNVTPIGGIIIYDPSTTGEGQNLINVDFNWTTSSTIVDKYKYYTTTAASCNGSNDSIETTYRNGSQQLGNGRYLLCVEMYHGDTMINSGSKPFTVDISPTLTVNESVSSNPISITWDPFIPDGCSLTTNPYTYTIKKASTEVLKNTGTGDTSLELNDLDIGSEYTYEIKMAYKKDRDSTDPDTQHIIKQGSFTVGGTAASLSINSPEDGDDLTDSNKTKKTVTFRWTGGGTQFHHYKYSLTKQGTTTPLLTEADGKTDPTDIDNNEFTYDLPNGRYTFTVEMYNSTNSNPIKSESSRFTVTIPSKVEIQSPATGSSIPSATTAFTWTGFTPYTCIDYEYELTGPDGFTPYSNTANCDETGFEIKNLRDGTYTFKIKMKYNDGEDKYTNYATSTFTVNSSTNKYLNITSPIDGGNYTPANGVEYGGDYKVPVTFTWNGGGSALVERYSYKIIDSSSHEILSDTIDKNDSGEYSISAQSLSKGSYTFEVDMLDSDNKSIMKKVHSFDVNLPARIKITNPTQGTTVTSSSTKFTWTGYSDTITNYQYNLVKSGDKDNIVNVNNRSFSRNLTNGNYTLTVWISSGGNLVASDTINFTVSRKSGGGGGGGGSSSKSHQTNKLSVDITNESPSTNEWIELKVDIDDKYTGKVDFTKMQYYSTEDEKWIDIPVTSKNYVSDYGDEAKLGYVKFDSSDDGEKELSNFIKISQKGNYRIYAEDKDGYNDYVQFYVGKGNGNNNTVKSTNTTTVTSTPTDTEDEVFIARSCKRYKITYSSSLNVYTSPNLNMSEYFMNKDYFKRYIDSKNRYQDGCPTNIGWISTSYYDKTNDNTRYTAPNGKVYFITGQEGNYYSNELNKELKTPTSFSTIQQLKYYIRDRNPLINMATLGPVS